MSPPSVSNKTPPEAIVEALVAEGVQFVFGVPGDHILSIYNVLYDFPSIHLVITKHENNASFMADMLGRLTGRPGVVLVTAGPGATNSISGLAQAYVSASPVVHISGAVPRGAPKEAVHGLDRDDFLYKMFQGATKWSVRVEHPDDISGTLAEAFSVAVAGRPGPVHVEIPEDLLLANDVTLSPYQPIPVTRRVLDETTVAEMAEALLSAQRPVICAGKGVLAHWATIELSRAADALSAPVVSVREAIGVMPDNHPLAAGHLGYYGNPQAPEWIEEADVVLAVGLRGGTADADRVAKLAPGQLFFIACDEEPTAASVSRASIQAVVDNRLFLADLHRQFNGRSRRADGALLSRIADAKVIWQKRWLEMIEGYRERTPIHFGLAVRELATQMDPEAIVVSGIGKHNISAILFVPVRHRHSHIQRGNWGTMGFELPGAIAAKLVHPEKQVIAITGDGSFLMSCNDLGTAVKVGANIVVLILNDSHYGAIRDGQRARYGRTYGTSLGSTNFAQFAESFGAIGIRVEQPGEIADAIAEGLAQAEEKPVVIDVVSGSDYLPEA